MIKSQSNHSTLSSSYVRSGPPFFTVTHLFNPFIFHPLSLLLEVSSDFLFSKRVRKLNIIQWSLWCSGLEKRLSLWTLVSTVSHWLKISATFA